jgi:hypothetical protein
MKIKIFEVNQNGKIEFTKSELEQLLNKMYDDGYEDGMNVNQSNITWTNPYTTPYSNTATTNFATENNKEESCECANPSLKSYPSITMKELSKEDMERVNKKITDLLNTNRSLRPHEVHDVFSNLAKELNF